MEINVKYQPINLPEFKLRSDSLKELNLKDWHLMSTLVVARKGAWPMDKSGQKCEYFLAPSSNPVIDFSRWRSGASTVHCESFSRPSLSMSV